MHITIPKNVSHGKTYKQLRANQLKALISNQLYSQSFLTILLYFQ